MPEQSRFPPDGSTDVPESGGVIMSGAGGLWVVRTDADPPPEVAGAIDALEPDRNLLLESAEGWRTFIEDVSDAPPELVVAVGGDGTVQGIVRALGPDSGTGVGIVPSGTGNDFARALELPLDPEEAARVVIEGTRRPVDLLALSVDGEDEVLAVNAVTLGLSGFVHAELDDETKARWGRFAYLKAALSAASGLEPFEAEISIRRSAQGDPTPFWTGPLLHISLANGPTAGGGVPIAPDADPADGRLHLCGVADATAWDIGKEVPAIFGDGSPGDPWLLDSVASVRLELASSRPVSVDGEPREARLLELRILPGALTVCLDGGGPQGPPEFPV